MKEDSQGSRGVVSWTNKTRFREYLKCNAKCEGGSTDSTRKIIARIRKIGGGITAAKIVEESLEDGSGTPCGSAVGRVDERGGSEEEG